MSGITQLVHRSRRSLRFTKSLRTLPGYFIRKLDLRGRTSHIDVEVSSVHRPVMALDVVIGEGPAVECERNMPAFARIQLNLRESLQFLHGPRDAGVQFAHVHFGNFGARTMASVGHVESDGDDLVASGTRGSNGKIPVCKRRVRKSKTEGELRLDPSLVKVAVSDENTFWVRSLFVPRLRVVDVVRGVVFPAALEGDRQLARRAVLAEQQLCQRRALCLTCVPRCEKRGNMTDPCVHVNRTARGHHDDRVLVRAGNLIDEFVLRRRKLKRAVRALTLAVGIEAHRQHHCIYLCRERFNCGVHYCFWTHDAEFYARTAPAPMHGVLETNLVCTSRQRQAYLADLRAREFPGVDDEFVVDIKLVAAAFARALHKKKMVARIARREVSRPAGRYFIWIDAIA